MKRAIVRRIVGAALLAFSTLPLFRILDTGTEAPFREASVEAAEATLSFVTWGSITTILLGLALALFIPSQRIRAGLGACCDRLVAIPLWKFASGLALVSTGLAVCVKEFLYRGFFTNVDEIASALQARYIAAGDLAGSLPGLPEGWLIPNMLMVEAGWVSQFPPSHLFLMAGAIKIGILPLMGPLFLGASVGLSTLVFPRILCDSPRAARLAAVGVALSPFLLSIGAGGLSHTSAGASALLALYAALRARDGKVGWAILAGGAVGLLVCSRPWIGLVLGSIATLGVWGPTLLMGAGDVKAIWFVKRVGGTLLGGTPFALFLGWYNTRLFGSPTSLGYLETFGERHQLGFHSDPWGYYYTLSDAIGFTSTDLLTFGIQLLETPIPLGFFIGLWLLTSSKLPRGAGILMAWAFAPLLANALYWFHDTRMLYEAAPAWLALATLAAADLTRADQTVRPRVPIRDIALWSTIVALLAAAGIGLPARIGSYRWSQDTMDRVTMPEIPGQEVGLVFVHTSWNERLSSQLQGAGEMRQDTVITTLRRNTNCGLQLYANARESRIRGGNASPELPAIDLLQTPGTPEGIERPQTPDGTTLRIRQGDPFPPECIAELNSDRFGAVALAPLLWQGDLPGLESGQPLFVRDLGPAKNARILDFFPDRTPFVFVPKADESPPEIVPYDEAMRVLWGVEGSDNEP